MTVNISDAEFAEKKTRAKYLVCACLFKPKKYYNLFEYCIRNQRLYIAECSDFRKIPCAVNLYDIKAEASSAR